MEKEQDSFLDNNKKPLAAIGLAVALTIALFFVFNPAGVQTINEKFFPQDTGQQTVFPQQEETGQTLPQDTNPPDIPQGGQNTYPQRGTDNQQGTSPAEGTPERGSSQTGENGVSEGDEGEEIQISPLSCSDLEGRICENGTTCSQEVVQTIDTPDCCFGECV